ncbi:MAG: hypothetical protein JO256_00640 [Alphaproteobacteria bacterium]|nr:hypothetical protein [Alphaproteobacteria bacterium]
MEIHKPKPVHSWRELLTEIGVIVIGVAIALSAEQGVEWWHWRGQVVQARQAIFAEIAANGRDTFKRRVAITPCVERQIAQSDAILTALENKKTPGKLTNFRMGSMGVLSDSEWQSERASQSLTHFPRAELALLSLYYTRLEIFQPLVNEERIAWQQLSILQNPPAGLTPSDLIRLRAALATAQNMGGLISLSAQRILQLTRQLGITVPATDPMRVNNFCTMSTLDEQRLLKAQEAAHVPKYGF